MVEETIHEFEVIEKDEPNEQESPVEKEVLSDMLHTYESNNALDTKPLNTEPPVVPPKEKKKPVAEPELEIKTVAEAAAEEEVIVENLPPYEPTLDLRDYKYPTLSLLETHGSEKIVQDANELENNKNQIISYA